MDNDSVKIIADESALISAAQSGDEEAFSQLVRHHADAIRAMLAVRLADPHEAEDLAQEVFLIAFQRLNEFDSKRPLRPWLRGMAMNLLRNYWRKFRPVSMGGNEELANLIDERISTEAITASHSGALEALHHCLERVEGPAKELLHLRYAEGFSVRELSRKLQKGYSALTMQLHRLREVVADCMQRKLTHPEASE